MGAQKDIACLLLVAIVVVNAQRAPYFTQNMNLAKIDETASVGSVVYTLKCLDYDGGNVTYDIDADMFIVDEFTGEVFLILPLNYESEQRVLRITVYCIDQEGLITSAQSTVNVVDANDNPATFLNQTYSITIPETSLPGYIVERNLTVFDVDFTNLPIQVTCNASAVTGDNTLYQEACNTFRLIRKSYSNKGWVGDLVLATNVDFETRPSYQLPLQTFDGVNRFLQSFEITLLDINDSPPLFTYVSPATVNESLPVNSNITFVTAIDGDKNDRRPIRYELDCTTGIGISLFAIDNETGIVINTRLLDRESVDLSQGYIDLCVKAREVISVTPEVLGNDSSTTATATIRINVRDQNDNAPTFHKSDFTVDIFENIPNESALPGLIMTVTDLDSATANSYNFVLLDNTDVFAVFPDSGQGQTTGSIKVIDTSKIDYENGPRSYILRVEAREVLLNQPSRLTGTATVTVNVLDVNDNIPLFTQAEYYQRIPETTNVGSSVVDISVSDPDSNDYGVAGVIYNLVGNGAEKFQIDDRTGSVSIAPCSPRPGVDTCIDYETTQAYELTVTATDELGRGLSRTARLRIDIQDINDNPPAFVESEYVRSIFEGKTVTNDPLLARATDRDTVGGPIRYSLSQGSPGANLWQIDPITANITARRPIKYEDTLNDQGFFDLTVIASDQVYNVTVDVRISVIDTNDNSPVFIPDRYSETIDESTKGNFPVLTVTATDQDSATTNNGKIEYGIETGAQGKFVINGESGAISTASDASFDYDTQRRYILLVLARDKGEPQATGTATVTVNIRDANNKDPYFLPTTRRADVYENAALGTSVINLQAIDPDASAALNYYFVEPISAITPDGIEVNRATYNFKDLFEVVEGTGRVQTRSNLDRDLTSVITYTVIVVDTSANPKQTGTGTLIINILEYNDQSPYFQLPFYNITIDEEQPIGAFIMTLIAQDDDDEIEQYEIFDDRGNYFSIAPTTGVLTVKNNIDYEKVQQTEFRARATDNGIPSRSNTTRVQVNIRNINDNSPIFTQTDYTKRIEEHSPLGTSVLTVTAIDRDLGDYGKVRYRIDSNETRLIINEESGLIQLAADLDREKQSAIAIQVTAYDSPKDISVRRYYTVPVYVYLDDINDNAPEFASQEYEQSIIETIDIGAQILQVFATDRDVGVNAAIAFSIVPGMGDSMGYFDVGATSGRITVNQGLRGKDGTYVFYVMGKDLNGAPAGLNDTAKVTIKVLKATNSPPVWVIPPLQNYTIEVLESQYLGMLVYDVEAVDDDNSNSGIVDYGFYYLGTYTTRTPEFSINPVTGVIKAEIVYDREARSRYVLLLSAKDRGDPALEATRFLTVEIKDVNDNVPKFPMSDGETIPYSFSIPETSGPGDTVGTVTATDIDTVSTVYYSILAGDRDTFGIDNNGTIYLKKEVDREQVSSYALDIIASNNISDYSVVTRAKRSTNPSIVTVRIEIIDVEDEAPVFTSFNGPNGAQEYYGCISSTAPFGKSVVEVAATDADFNGRAGISFSLTAGNTGDTFAVDPVTGLVTNKNLLGSISTKEFYITVTATDKGNLSMNAPVKIFVVTPENEAKIVINQRSSEVRLFIQQLRRLIQQDRGVRYVCVTGISEHVTAAGRIDNTQTDVFVTAMYGGGNSYKIYSTQELLTVINDARSSNLSGSYDGLYITGTGTRTKEEDLTDYTPVLAVLIIVILLVIMAIILLCLACYCIADSKKKKLRKTEARRFTVVTQEPVKDISPVYDNKAFYREEEPVRAPIPIPNPNDDYAVVQKKRPPSDDVLPVAAPIVISQSFTEPAQPSYEGPVPVIETTVVEDEPPVLQSHEPGPVIVTEIYPDPEPQVINVPQIITQHIDPEPQAVYIPDPEPQAVYIPDPEPQAVYIPDPEPQTVYIPDPDPEDNYIPSPEPVETVYIPDAEPPTTFQPIPEVYPTEGIEEVVVEVKDDTPLSTTHVSPPTGYSPPASPTSQQKQIELPSLQQDDDNVATDMM
ncbi:cadherin-87A-like [Haliotis asinina]|uniref:cadherin-87A-like n=1 Tax=Haliotis asinina TaxID=109174 RepID=UPI003532224B